MEINKQLLYKLIYNIKYLELETIKTNSFIKSSKLFVLAFILLVKILNKNICVNINYQDLNNLIIKSSYLLLLMNKFFNQLN